MKNDFKIKKGTTIAVDIATSEALDGYCKRCGILKKDFVRIALEWFDELDIDITSETHYKPEQMIRDAELEQLPIVKQQVNGLYQLLSGFIDKATINIDSVVKTAEDLGNIRAKNESLKSQNKELLDRVEELSTWKRNAIEEFVRVQDQQKVFGKIKIKIPM